MSIKSPVRKAAIPENGIESSSLTDVKEQMMLLSTVSIIPSGIDVDATGTINLATGSSSGGAITLDAAFNNGGVNISSGTQGLAINSNGGLIGIGHWNGCDMNIGTAAVARSIILGNNTSTTSLNLTLIC